MTLPGTREELAPGQRIEGFLVGALVGGSLAAASPSPGRRHASTALADGLLEELLGQGVDLHRLAGRWLDWYKHDGLGADPLLVQSLNHLRDFDAPVPPPSQPSLAPISAVLPSALAGASPQQMVIGAFHVAGLLDPNESAALAGVSVVVACARLLEGKRDFVADVIAMLRANDAPERLLEGVRTIPRDPRTAPPVPKGESVDPVDAAIWLLWQAHHRPRGMEAMLDMSFAENISPHIGAALGAMMGARDGMQSWPTQWFLEMEEELVLRKGVARRLNRS